MTDFRALPKDADRRVKLTRRRDEIGAAQRGSLKCSQTCAKPLQKNPPCRSGRGYRQNPSRLHNILSTALLVSGRIKDSVDPEMRWAAPIMMRAIENLARDTNEAGAETVIAAVTTIGVPGVRVSIADNGPGNTGAI